MLFPKKIKLQFEMGETGGDGKLYFSFKMHVLDCSRSLTVFSTILFRILCFTLKLYLTLHCIKLLLASCPLQIVNKRVGLTVRRKLTELIKKIKAILGQNIFIMTCFCLVNWEEH